MGSVFTARCALAFRGGWPLGLGSGAGAGVAWVAGARPAVACGRRARIIPATEVRAFVGRGCVDLDHLGEGNWSAGARFSTPKLARPHTIGRVGAAARASR